MKLADILDENLINVNSENLQRLQTKIKKEETTFVLGAGVSIPAGLPGWDGLLARIWARILEIEIPTNSTDWKLPERKEYVEVSETARRSIRHEKSDGQDYIDKASNALDGGYAKLFEKMNLLEVAEYIRNYVMTIQAVDDKAERRHLEAAIINSLIKEATKIPDDRLNALKTDMEDSFLNKLAVFLADNKGRRHCNVITYNYDNLLEFFLSDRCENSKVRVICDDDSDKSWKNGKINIFHLHGYLEVVDSKIRHQDTEKIILTESSYYEMEEKVYRWENSIQARALLDTTCIFVGFSGQDYNFRRMIKNMEHIDSDSCKVHYIFFSIDPFVKILFGEDALKRMKMERVDELLNGKTGMTNTQIGDALKAMIESDDIGSAGDTLEKYMVQNAKDDRFVYEQIQLIHFLYAQYIYWSYHGIIPIWTTYDELPEMMSKLRDK